MTLNRDYHIHTKLCRHAGGEMYEYIEKAIEKGLAEIAFTDHIPLPDKFDAAHRMAEHELEEYCSKIDVLEKTYQEIKILRGIEADYYAGFEGYLNSVIRNFDFDLVIMSVHFIKGWPKDNWAFSYHFPDKTYSEIYRDYLKALSEGIKTELFDIVGHLDLIKSPEESLIKHNAHEVEELLTLISSKRMAVEINTSGLRKQIGELFPHQSIIKQLIRNDIPLTFGSDAHQPEHVGFYFEELSDYLETFNKVKTATFDKRKLTIKEYLRG